MDSTRAEEDVEYDSDPEEAKRSLTLRRRREASDDEEEDEREGRDDRDDHRVAIRSDDGSDGEGGVADYGDDDDDDGDEEELEEELEEEVYEEEGEIEEEVYGERGVEEEHAGGVEGSMIVVKESSDGAGVEDSAEVHSEEKKENEPFAVPTAGAFYMHDDRFRDNAGARNRRIRGGRRLWESRDDRKWGHDKFEELTLQERHYDEGIRPSKGNYRGRARSRGRGTDRGGYVRGNRKAYNNSSNQIQVPIVRGRGPRRYEPNNKSNGRAPQIQNKQSGKSLEKNSNISLERASTPISNVEPDSAPTGKQALASNLNYASPPFYPSGSSNKDINLTQKRDAQTGSSSSTIQSSVMDQGFPVQPNNALLRGKNIVEQYASIGKPMNNMHMAPPGSSGVDASQSPHPHATGRGGIAIPVHMNYQPAPLHFQVNKVSPTQPQVNQSSSAPGRTSTSVQATARQLGHRPGSGSHSSSPPKTSASNNSFDSGELDAASESAKFKGALVGKGRGGPLGGGRGSFVYGGAQLMGPAGNVSVTHGDPNFPAFLPVMQFGGQNPRGIGVPAVGMAFPGYVGNPQLGLGNSEMTWLPVLAGAAGALGASYCSPYLSIDGSYSRQSGQTSVTDTSSKENNANKNDNESKPPQRSELVSDEFGQRQNKPRRYSEMNFGQ
ncbi:hypothetical protein RIF29_28733 [Crotalaria pallida]|uniref:Btz domain-containing protein n=1 Tax=Crotalaria pallida TaxID=3830 RepID=A0AAN9HZN3_CROPI